MGRVTFQGMRPINAFKDFRALALLAMCFPASLSAQNAYSYTLFGTVGLLDMPSADSAEDAELTTSINMMSTATRATITFQLAPRLSASFRYSGIGNWVPLTGQSTFDRSFDLQYRLFDEGRYRPAIAVGLRDFMGTGIYSSEYLVATKHLSSRLSLTGGLGWGRLGSYNGFTNPLGALDSRFETRAVGTTGKGGQPEFNKWFRGDAALFGGLEWKATDKFTLKAEYSSDAYRAETARGHFDRKSPVNVGLSYAARPGVDLQAAYMHGDVIAFGATFATNPKKPINSGGVGPAPYPVVVRAPGAARDLGWTAQPNGTAILRDNVQTFLAQDGITLEGMQVTGQAVTLHIRPGPYLNQAQAIGRTARILTRTMPASVEAFKIVPVIDGMPTAAVSLKRRDIEELEAHPDGAWLSYSRATIGDASAAKIIGAPDGLYPKLNWSFGPYAAASLFDPDSPVRADIGLKLAAKWDIAPGLFISGNVTKRLVGNRDKSTRFDPSALQRVRTDSNIYAREGDPAIPELVMAYYARPGKDLYTRVTAGYLEPQFGGLSAEVLWKPVDSRLAFGAEVNYVKQRDFDQLFGFRAYETVTGHASAYYDFGNGYHGQVDAGRYLAGDWGATFALDRTFANGWRVGAYATFTDVSFNDFGEGSFDKGLRLTIPLEQFLGTPTARKSSTTLSSLARDGGARLNVNGRLYETIRDSHQPELKRDWGGFWR